jgi:hypothetical protein
MEHVISITAVDTTLGTPQDNIGIMGLISKAVAVAPTFALDTPYLLTQLSDLEALGITAAYDAANNLAFHQQVSEFYTEAGTGALLWVQGCSTATAYAEYVTGSAFYNFIQYSGTADPDNLIRMVGLCYNVPATQQSAADFPADVSATITALQTTYASMYQDGFPWSAILDGYNMSSTVNPATVGSMATNTAFAVSLCVTSTLGNGVSQVGMALGRYARIALGRGIGNAADGAVSQVTAFLTNSIIIPTTGTLVVGSTYYVSNGTVLYNGVTYQTGKTFVAVMGFTSYTTADTGYLILGATPVQNLTPAYVKQLGQKQYLFVTQLKGKSGFYWNDGATCISQTEAFAFQEYNRIVNDATLAALNFWTNEHGDDLPTDVATGDLDPVWVNTKQNEFNIGSNSYFGPLVSAGSIVAGQMLITGPGFATNPNPQFSISIVRKSIIGNITGTVQYVSTL